ncbi:hypothetical protein, partial [Escherichia coli]|uniref:hypothetical protein n=1 Tax=Escherichia coli TaxID=562 RepID=UPI0032D9F6C6
NHKENNTTYFFETPPSYPYNTHINPCDYIPPATDEIEILKAKIEVFTRMAKEDTSKLKAEIKSELKDYLATLREEGLPLEEVETKMLSMMEELMKTSSLQVNYPIVDDLSTLEAIPRGVHEVEKEQNSREEVSVEEIVECDTPVLEEVPIFELENQKEVEMESEDDDIELVWEDEEPKYSKIPNLSCANFLENPCALIENTFDTCVDDSPLNCNSDLYAYDTTRFYFQKDDSIGFVNDDSIN